MSSLPGQAAIVMPNRHRLAELDRLDYPRYEKQLSHPLGKLLPIHREIHVLYPYSNWVIRGLESTLQWGGLRVDTFAVKSE
jgi:hypothetical protein